MIFLFLLQLFLRRKFRRRWQSMLLPFGAVREKCNKHKKNNPSHSSSYLGVLLFAANGRGGLGEVPDVRGSSACLKIYSPIEIPSIRSCSSAGILPSPCSPKLPSPSTSESSGAAVNHFAKWPIYEVIHGCLARRRTHSAPLSYRFRIAAGAFISPFLPGHTSPLTMQRKTANFSSLPASPA